MATAFKRSVLGFGPSVVKSLLEETEADFESKRATLSGQIEEETSRCQGMRGEVMTAKNQLEEDAVLEDKVRRHLLDAHRGAIEAVYGALKDAKEKERSALVKVQLAQNELDRLRSTMAAIKEELLTTIARYATAADDQGGTTACHDKD